MSDAQKTAEELKAEADAAAAALIKPDKPVVPDPVAETAALKQRVADFEFKEKIGEVSKTYPHAAEFSDKIQELVRDKGYSIEDASIVVLNKEGKMQTAEQIARSANAGDRSSGLGGSMDSPIPRDKKDPKPGDAGSAEFFANRFKDLEAKGEIRMT